MTDQTRDAEPAMDGTTGRTPETPRDRSGAWYRPKGIEDVRDVYADQADQMARMEFLNRLLSGRYRRRLFERAEGRVVDVACGTGTNVRYVPDDVSYVGVDISPDMLTKARNLYGDDPDVALEEMDAQALSFDDDSFDTVISSLSTCTFPDPIDALTEMRRVCKPDGRILLLEHGRSSLGPIARFQDWRADAHYEKHACRWNQEPMDLVDAAGLKVRETRTALAGIITAIDARPD